MVSRVKENENVCVQVKNRIQENKLFLSFTPRNFLELTCRVLSSY